MKRIKEFFTRQGPYYEVLWNISYILAGIWAFYRWIESLFLTAHEGNFWGFILIFILQSLIMGFNTIIGGIILFLILFVLTFIPFLIIKKFFVEIKKTKKTVNINETDNQIQEAEYIWTCDYCGKEFSSESEADEHELICEKNIKYEEDVWTCDFCNKEFETQKEADKHEKICELNLKNKETKTKVYCINCGVENPIDANFCKKCGNKIII